MNWSQSILTFISFISLTTSVYADSSIDFTDTSTETLIPQKPPRQSPFTFSIDLDWVSPTKIKKGFFKGDTLKFAEADAELGFIFLYHPQYKEGANLVIGYTETLLDWPGNLWFSQNHFHTVSLSLGGFSERLCRWFWRGQITVNMDTSEWQSNYMNYDFLLWGRYEYSSNFGLHVGLFAQAGMYMERVYPILGIDWQASDKWKINLVFPVNVSIEYCLNSRWTLLLAGRNFDSRHRVKRTHCERDSQPVWRYQNVGAEFAVKYVRDNMKVNVHAGSTLGGQLRIANHRNQHPHHFKLNPSLYAGADVSTNF